MQSLLALCLGQYDFTVAMRAVWCEPGDANMVAEESPANVASHQRGSYFTFNQGVA